MNLLVLGVFAVFDKSDDAGFYPRLISNPVTPQYGKELESIIWWR
jgi:hypothetical protein